MFEMLEQFIGEADIYTHIMAVLVGMPRLFVVAFVAPFLGSAVVSGQLRMVLVSSFYMILHPALVALLPQMENLNSVFSFEYIIIVVKEGAIGLLLGYIGALIFWAVQSAGFFIDNQRGAGQASGSEILSGDQTSPTGGFFFQAITYLFFTTGGFLTYLTLVYGSYIIFPPVLEMNLNIDFVVASYFGEKFSWIFYYMLLLAAPISIACLLTDISLGLMNRFAPQLNVYVLAMPIKSGLASFLLCFYIVILLEMMPDLYAQINLFIHEALLLLNR